MRMRSIVTVGIFLLAAQAQATAAPLKPAGLDTATPALTLVQAKKSETLTHKVKRAWKNLVGYKFDVACVDRRSSCRETGDSRAAAQSKCIARNPFCWVSDAN